MEEFIIAIEETVVEEFKVMANNEKEAMKIAFEKYKNKEFILEPGETQYAQMAVVSPIRKIVEWIEI